jgi:hypothetical protein
MQLLDAWGNPIRFYRYGYLALSGYPNLPTIAQEHLGTPSGSKDPLDREGVLNPSWWITPTGQPPPNTTNGSWHYSQFQYPLSFNSPPADYLPLLLVSAGPDGVFGTSDDILSYTLRPVAGGR